MQHCMFCGNRAPEVPFDTEHVLPEHLAGRWKIDNSVCKSCNGHLGHEVDHQADSFLDVLASAQQLGLRKLEDNLLKHRFNGEAQLTDGTPLHAQFDGKAFHVPTQSTSAGWRFYPSNGNEFVAPLTRNLERKARERHVTETTAAREIGRIISALSGAATFEVVHSQILATQFMKKRERLSERLQPKHDPKPERLLAKIAYEVLFLVGGQLFFDTPELRTTLARIINGEMPSGVVSYRKKAFFSQPQDFHKITVLSVSDLRLPYIELSLFGYVDLLLLINRPLLPSFWDQFALHFGLSHPRGLAYWQGVTDDWMEFKSIGSDGKPEPLRP